MIAELRSEHMAKNLALDTHEMFALSVISSPDGEFDRTQILDDGCGSDWSSRSPTCSLTNEAR